MQQTCESGEYICPYEQMRCVLDVQTKSGFWDIEAVGQKWTLENSLR